MGWIDAGERLEDTVRIVLVTPVSEPALEGRVTGNDVTARRWEDILRKLGHDVTLQNRYEDGSADALVALHARKSAPSIQAFMAHNPNKPVVVALTGTDLYEDYPEDETVCQSLESASQVVTLQPAALDVLDASIRPKTSVIYQSAMPFVPALKKAEDCFQVCLIGHLRAVKDPLLAIEAVRKLDPLSRTRIVHAGAAADDALEARAREASDEKGSRYRWIGALPHEEARVLIARSHALLLTSRAEGGANVLSEALAIGVPILASRVNGVEGLLGAGYPGLFPPGDADALAEALARAEHDEIFYRRLELAGRKLAPMVAPSWEMRSWQQLLDALK